MADNEVEEEFNITLIDPTKLDEEERKAQRLSKIDKQIQQGMLGLEKQGGGLGKLAGQPNRVQQGAVKAHKENERNTACAHGMPLWFALQDFTQPIPVNRPEGLSPVMDCWRALLLHFSGFGLLFISRAGQPALFLIVRDVPALDIQRAVGAVVRMAADGVAHMGHMLNGIKVGIINFLPLTCGIHQAALIQFTLLE